MKKLFHLFFGVIPMAFLIIWSFELWFQNFHDFKWLVVLTAVVIFYVRLFLEDLSKVLE